MTSAWPLIDHEPRQKLRLSELEPGTSHDPKCCLSNWATGHGFVDAVDIGCLVGIVSYLSLAASGGEWWTMRVNLSTLGTLVRFDANMQAPCRLDTKVLARSDRASSKDARPASGEGAQLVLKPLLVEYVCRYLERISAAVEQVKAKTEDAPVCLLAHSAGYVGLTLICMLASSCST